MASIGSGSSASTSARSSLAIMLNRKRAVTVVAAAAGLGQGLRDALGLQAVEAPGEGGALLGRMQQPLAAIALAGLLLDPALVHQLLEDAGQALLGDLQDLEQVGDAKPRMAVDEMQHAVMRAPETQLGERRVRLAGEVAVGEEQQLDEGDEVGIGVRLPAICPSFGQPAPDACSRARKLCQPC